MASASIARVLLLLIVLAYLVNLARGTGTQWLRAKFIGTPTPQARSAS